MVLHTHKRQLKKGKQYHQNVTIHHGIYVQINDFQIYYFQIVVQHCNSHTHTNTPRKVPQKSTIATVDKLVQMS